MSILQKIENALSGIDFAVGKVQYPDKQGSYGKVVFNGYEKSTNFYYVKPIDV